MAGRIMRVGIIGIGNMGMGMAKRLLAEGHAVHVRDIRPEAEAEARALGASVEPSPAALARHVDTVVVIVLNAAQIEDVLFGIHGVADAARPELTVVLSSTIAPNDTADFAERLARHGVECVDAPVSGGPARAIEGTISMMVAGHPHAITQTETLLNVLASRVFRIGDQCGDAAKAKLVNNLLAAINLVAGASALALSKRIGLDTKLMYELICASSGQSWVFADRMTRALNDDYQPRAHAHVLTKDLGLALDMARGAAFEAPLGDYALQIFRATCAAGWANDDDASVFKTLSGGPAR